MDDRLSKEITEPVERFEKKDVLCQMSRSGTFPYVFSCIPLKIRGTKGRYDFNFSNVKSVALTPILSPFGKGKNTLYKYRGR